MNPEAWAVIAAGAALGGLVMALGVFVWQTLRSFRPDVMRRFGEVDKKFEDVAKSFREVGNRPDRLAEDHHGPAREPSELRGGLRGRLDERACPASG